MLQLVHMRLHIVAHGAIIHDTKSADITHFIKTDGLKVLLISLVAVGLLIIIAKLMADKPHKSKTGKEEES